MAMTMLNEMPAALSNKLVRRSWFINGRHTSYSDTSSNPGRKVFLLPLIRFLTGPAVTNFLLYFVRVPIIVLLVLRVFPLVVCRPAGTVLLLPYVPNNPR